MFRCWEWNLIFLILIWSKSQSITWPERYIHMQLSEEGSKGREKNPLSLKKNSEFTTLHILHNFPPTYLPTHPSRSRITNFSPLAILTNPLQPNPPLTNRRKTSPSTTHPSNPSTPPTRLHPSARRRSCAEGSAMRCVRDGS